MAQMTEFFYRFVEVRVGLKVLSGLIVVFSGIENKVLAIWDEGAFRCKCA